MSYWNVVGGRVRVYTYKDQKVVCLPRALTAHLDGAEEHIVDAWVSCYDAEHRTRKPQPQTTDEFQVQVERFRAFLDSRRKDPTTIGWHISSLKNHIIPFFLLREARQFAQWPQHSIKMLEELQNKGLSNHQIVKANQALNQFWKWLMDEGLVYTAIRTRAPITVKVNTPLKFTLTPDSVLEWVNGCRNPQLRFLALAGFFFSLRPQETFALTPQHFIAGSRATILECSKVMAEHKLFSRLVVKIDRQANKKGEFTTPKAGSSGWVACFDERAARQLIVLLKEHPLDQILFTNKLDWVGRLWASGGIPNITLKDLRRASIYWLGHYTSMGIQELANHARHANIETTRIYLRRPDEFVEGERFLLDLDA